MPLNTSYDTLLLNKLTVEKMMAFLSSEERDIINLWCSGSFTLEEIGRVIGQKYHGYDVKSSIIRYHRDKILRKLRETFHSEET